jgi:site-specific recombinase XerD
MTDNPQITPDIWQEAREFWLSSRNSENTRRSYQNSLDDFLKSTRIDLAHAERKDMLEWVEMMKTRNLKPKTIAVRFINVLCFFRFACEQYRIDDHSILQISSPVIRRILPKTSKYSGSRVLSKEEIARLIGNIDLHSQNGLRDYALVTGYLVLGRRNSEWRLARVKDFDMRDGEIYFHWSGKGHVDEVLSVPEELWKVLQTYISASGGRKFDEYIFLDRDLRHPLCARRIGQIVKRCVARAGIEGRVRVHDLRHTAVQLRRNAGADVEEIRDFLGHSSLATTQIYLHRIERSIDERGSAVAKMINLGRKKQ